MIREENYYANLVQNRKIATIPTFTLESGLTLTQVPVAYTTWGRLNAAGNNVLVVCHAFTGSSDASDWWRPLMGPGKAIDYTRYFVFCANTLGSPYGSASPLSINPSTQRQYGPEFPRTTIRDDVRIHKITLDILGVQGVAVVIGGSMGGMHTLKWPLCTPPEYVKNLIPIATSAYQGAWGISWSETQDRAIRADAAFNGGWYHPIPECQPRQGLGVARMIGMLTYRSSESFEARFGRRTTSSAKPRTTNARPSPPLLETKITALNAEGFDEKPRAGCFSAQAYLQYQGDKFLDRFDANCYLHLLAKMNTHDVSRGRDCDSDLDQAPTYEHLKHIFKAVPNAALVIGVQSDLLFPLQQQISIAQCLPKAKFVALESNDGHDGFLLEFTNLNQIIMAHLKSRCAWLYEEPALLTEEDQKGHPMDSIFGEVESIQC